MISPAAIRRMKRLRVVTIGVWVGIFPAAPVIAADYTGDSPVFQADYGGTGLMQTPTARMAPTGEFDFTYSHIDPYSNYAFSFQPFSWFQAGFRYTSVKGRAFNSSTPNRDYLDKGVDLKLDLLNERRFLPQVAVGFRDFGGTGLFGSEFFVANKRYYQLDFSAGLGWGYLGSRGDIKSPFDVLSNQFDDRSHSSGTGNFNLTNLFSGRAAFFGGVQYHTPFKPLTLQVEYEGNDYNSEPLNLDIHQKSPVNVGARLALNRNVVLSAAWERGNEAMLGVTLRLDTAHLSQPKTDPAPVPLENAPAHTTDDWHGTLTALAKNAGVNVTSVKQSGSTLIVEGTNTRYRDYPQAELRANRILSNATSDDITKFEYRWTSRGFYLREDSLPRAPLPGGNPFIIAPDSVFAQDDYRLGVKVYDLSDSQVAASDSQTLYKSPLDRFSWGLRPAFQQNYGGPDGYLYNVLADLDLEFDTDEHGWFSGTLGYSLFDNYDKFNFTAPSKLPRVRTYINQYTNQTTLGVYNLQYTRTARLADNWFGLAYAGLLEQQYGGAGGEVLYRPFNSPVAFGIDANYVRQRAFDTRFDFRSYQTVEGHATTYIDTGWHDVLAQVSVGRYLAKDYGATVNISRQFQSGVRLGAYATYTSASVENKFGEGSFDKGIYMIIPLDGFFTRSTRRSVGVGWSPLTRDGGAFLNRRYDLYSLTYDRSLNGYWDGFESDTD